MVERWGLKILREEKVVIVIKISFFFKFRLIGVKSFLGRCCGIVYGVLFY